MSVHFTLSAPSLNFTLFEDFLNFLKLFPGPFPALRLTSAYLSSVWHPPKSPRKREPQPQQFLRRKPRFLGHLLRLGLGARGFAPRLASVSDILTRPS